MEKKELKKYVFNNLLINEGVSLRDIDSSSKEITQIFTKFKKLLISNGLIKPSEKISRAKQIEHNGIVYLVIRKTSAEYIIINLEDKSFVSDKSLFDQKFFIKNFNERAEIKYDSYMFSTKAGAIEKIYEYFLKNQTVLGMDNLYIFYTKTDDLANVIVYYSVITGETVIHLREINYSNNDQIVLDKDFTPIDLIKTEYTDKIPNIKIPKELLPKFIQIDKKFIK